MSSDDQEPEERALSGAYDMVAQLALRCRHLREQFDGREWLEEVINFLMTELWDQNFSQTEIRRAFTEALEDMNRYAAGEERRVKLT